MTTDPVPETSLDTEPATTGRGHIGRRWWAVGIAIAALVVVVLAPLASPDPDGLERVAEDAGFIERATNFWGGLLSGYAIPGIEDPAVSTIVSGLLGVAIVVVLAVVLGRVVARRKA
jgi:ABC-type Fe3+ transport system permease subunit